MKTTIKKTLRKAQAGLSTVPDVSTKKTMFGRTKVTKSQDNDYPYETAKSVRTDVYNKKGDFVKSKTKSTITDKATGDTYTMKVKAKSKGPNEESKKRVSRAIFPVKKKGGSVKSKKK